MTTRRHGKLKLALLAALVGIVCMEGFSAITIAVVADRIGEPIVRTRTIYARQTAQIQSAFFSDSARSLQFDPHLGWTYAPHWRDSMTVHNSLGLRGEREYPRERSPETVRIAAFGDSFVYGHEVRHTEAWPAVMEQLYPGFEVLNYGVGGYGVDQAFLRFLRDGRQLDPAVVLICFTTDDLRRLVNVYRRFLSAHEIPLFKPRFRLDQNGATLLPTPVQSLSDYRALINDPARVRAHGEFDAWYEPLVYENPLYDWSATVRLTTTAWIKFSKRYVRRDRLFDDGTFRPESDAFRLQMSLFEAFRDSVALSGAVPLIVLLPDRGSVASLALGGRTHYAPLAEQLAAQRIAHVDAAEAFTGPDAGASIDTWFMPHGHYSASANALVARWLGARVRELVQR